MASDELHDWQDLLESPGWTRLVEHIGAEWGKDEGNGAAFRQAVRDVANNPSDAAMAAQLRQVLAAQKAVQKLLGLPEQRIAELKRNALSFPHEGRRGAL